MRCGSGRRLTGSGVGVRGRPGPELTHSVQSPVRTASEIAREAFLQVQHLFSFKVGDHRGLGRSAAERARGCLTKLAPEARTARLLPAADHGPLHLLLHAQRAHAVVLLLLAVLARSLLSVADRHQHLLFTRSCSTRSHAPRSVSPSPRRHPRAQQQWCASLSTTDQADVGSSERI